MALGAVSSVSSYFTGLISQLMAVERQPLTALRQEKSALEAKRTVFSDLGLRFSALQAAVDTLSSSAPSPVFDKRTASLSDIASGKTVVSASASASAISGTYSLSITTLAREHRVRSDQQTYADQALNLSGTILVGGAAARSQSTAATIANTVTGFGVGDIASGQKELGAETYYVETRNDATYGWQFRVVDADGNAVSVQQAASSGSYTANWQSVPTGGGAYDTGRGLTVTFGADSGQYQAASKGAGAAQLAYTAQGASITVAAADSLNTIASAINSATFASGNEVIATVVDRQLVLAAKNTGASHAVVASDSSGTVLQSLGVLTGAGAFKNVMQAASDASFTVNGLTVARGKNTGLDDVISGVTLNLAADAGGQTATLVVAPDSAAVRSQVETLLKEFNSLAGYLRKTTAITSAGADNSGRPTFNRGPLANDFTYVLLSGDLLSDLTASVSGLPAGSPGSLGEIGIKLGDTLEVSISNSAAFDAALASNPSGVEALLAAVADRLDSRLNRFNDSTSGALAAAHESVDDQMSALDKRVAALNVRLADREAALTRQYARLQAQVLQMVSLQDQLSAMSGSGLNLFA